MRAAARRRVATRRAARSRSTNMRTGILGGSFNPIHLGHLHIAAGARRTFGLLQVHFVVATFPPHKRLEQLVPFSHRYAMVTLATARTAGFVPSLIELEPPASAYSIDTVAKFLRAGRGSPRDLYFIAGSDSLGDIAGWRKSRELLLACNFIFVVRKGAEVGDPAAVLPAEARPLLQDLRAVGRRHLRRHVETVLSRRGGSKTHIFLVDLGAPAISASHIRRLAAAGRPFGHLVPVSVRTYIQKLNLYGASCRMR